MKNDRFRADLKRVIEKGKTNQSLFIRKLLLEIDRRLVLKSPVDTGRFRANWVVGSYNIDDSTTDSTDKTGATTLAKHQHQITGIKYNGQMVYITNSLPYAFPLEYGWSDKAPQGMVRITVEEIESIAGDAVKGIA